MAETDRIRVDLRWSEVERIGPCWAGGLNLGLHYPWGKEWTSIVGFAVDRSRRLLPIKCLMEAMECLAYHDARLTRQSRSGLAAHFTKKEAEEKAYLELIERDAFLFHWLCELPGKQIHWRDYKEITGDLDLISIEEAGKLNCIQLLAADPQTYVCVAASRVPSSGCWHVGLGSERDLGKALAKATREWLGLVLSHRITDGKCPPDIFPDGQPNVFSIHHISSKQEMVSKLLDYIVSSGGSILMGDLVGSHLWEETQFWCLPVRSCEYSVVCAENSRLMPLYFGDRFVMGRESYLKNDRLRNAFPELLKYHSQDQFLPHPLN